MTFTPPSSSCSSMSIQVVFSLFHLHIYLVGHVSIKNMSKYSKVTNMVFHLAQCSSSIRKECSGHRCLRHRPTGFSLSQTQHCHSEEDTVVTKSGRIENGAIYLMWFNSLPTHVLLKKTQI